jgi:hypothetical protein
MAVLTFFLSPIGRWLAGALIILALVGGIYGKGRYDDHVAYTAKIEREKQDAIKKGSTARDSALKRFDNGRLRDDGFARDK